MKKILALFLLALLLTSCRDADVPAEETAEEESHEPVVVVFDSEEPEEEAPVVIEKPDIERYTSIPLDGKPEYENGVILLHFNQTVTYEEDAAVSVGIILADRAESIGGKIVTGSYSDLMTEKGEYWGLAVKPDEKLPSGMGLFSITFGEYVVSFEMNVR